MKIGECYICKKKKLLKEFSKNKTKKFGINHECRECRKEYDRKRFLNEDQRIKRKLACKSFSERNPFYKTEWVLKHFGSWSNYNLYIGRRKLQSNKIFAGRKHLGGYI